MLKRGEALRPPPTPAPSRPTNDEVVSRPGPPASAADSPTAGTGRGGTQPGRVAQPPAGGPGESPTESTGQAAGAATGAALGSSAAAGVSPTVTAGRPPGPPAGAATGGNAAGGATSGGTAPTGGSTPPTGGATAGGATSGGATGGGAMTGGGSTPGATGSTPATTSSTSGSTPTQGGGAQAVAAFRFRGIKQEERKRLVFRYTRSEATQRSYAPQGFFGLLAGDLDKKSHFIEVDLDDPFFRRFEIKVSTIPDFAAIGLRAAEIALSYGKPGDPGGVKSQNLRFEGQNAAEQSWTVFQNDGDVQSLRYTVQFHFDPASGFEGSKFSYEFGPFETTDRTIVLNPFEHVGVRTISAVANKIDWGQIERVEAALTSGQQKKTLVLTEAAKEAAWKLRLDDPAARAVGYSTTFVMKDRTTRGGEAGTTEASSILIDDPFPEGLSLQLIPILDAARTRLAFVDFDYADAPSGFKRSERFRIAPTDVDREVAGRPAQGRRQVIPLPRHRRAQDGRDAGRRVRGLHRDADRRFGLTDKKRRDKVMTKRAVVVGINDYSVQGVNSLAMCVRDARSFYHLLVDAFLFEPDNILTYLDLKADSAVILKALRYCVAQSQPGDVICFYYAGHGSRLPHPTKAGQFYEVIIPASGAMDFRPRAVQHFRRTAAEPRQFHLCLRQLPFGWHEPRGRGEDACHGADAGPENRHTDEHPDPVRCAPVTDRSRGLRGKRQERPPRT